jgi:hypothetical protein
MKNWKFLVLAITFMGLLAWQTHQQKKTYKVEQTIEFWGQATNGLEATKNYLKSTNLPAKEVTFFCDSILTPIKDEMYRQVSAQLAAEQKKDSTTTKPKK